MASDKIIRAGVIGHPVAHSLSPVIHGYWLKKYGIKGTYEKIDILPENLEKFLKEDIFKQKYAGVNVTIPHKIDVYNYIHEYGNIKREAGLVGAVNTVVVEKDGILRGDNTDAYGFLSNLKGLAIKKGTAVILGAGGAAAAVGASLLDFNTIVIVNRTTQNAEEMKKHWIKSTQYYWSEYATKQNVQDLAKKIEIKSWKYRSKILEGINVLINATSLGMVGQPPLDIDLSLLPKEALVVDIVYNPLETELLKQARKRGNPTVDGLGMLLHQAAPGFEAWFGKKPEVTEELRQEVIAALQKR